MCSYRYTPSRGGGCAKSPDRIATAYISPFEYQSYDCNQLALEFNRIQRNLAEVTEIQQGAYERDSSRVLALPTIIFAPVILAIEGDTGREAELGRLRGELDAVEHALIQSNCPAAEYIEKIKKQAK